MNGEANDQDILAWCQKWGLLGLLPARVLTVVLEPMRTKKNKHPNSPGFQKVLTRSRDGWQSKLRNPPGRPGVVLQSQNGGNWERQNLDEDWASFFPSVPKRSRTTHQYPLPNTPDFWKIYAEPLEDIREHAISFNAAITRLASREPPTDEEFALSHNRSSIGDEDYQKLVGVDLWMDARDKLMSAISEVRPSLVVDKANNITQQWVSRSLHGAMAMMALLDLSDSNSRLVLCEHCSLVVRKYHPRARFCSEACRKAREVARYRQRRKRKNEIAS